MLVKSNQPVMHMPEKAPFVARKRLDAALELLTAANSEHLATCQVLAGLEHLVLAIRKYASHADDVPLMRACNAELERIEQNLANANSVIDAFR